MTLVVGDSDAVRLSRGLGRGGDILEPTMLIHKVTLIRGTITGGMGDTGELELPRRLLSLVRKRGLCLPQHHSVLMEEDKENGELTV